MPKLTKRFVEAVKPGPKGTAVWDDEVTGFGLRVYPSGKRSYIIQYRSRGRCRRYTIGRHGIWTPDSPPSFGVRVVLTAPAQRERRTPLRKSAPRGFDDVDCFGGGLHASLQPAVILTQNGFLSVVHDAVMKAFVWYLFGSLPMGVVSLLIGAWAIAAGKSLKKRWLEWTGKGLVAVALGIAISWVFMFLIW